MTRWSGQRHFHNWKIQLLGLCMTCCESYIFVGILHMACGMWDMAYGLCHMAYCWVPWVFWEYSSLTDLRLTCFKGHIIARNWQQEYLKIGKNFVIFSKHAFIIAFTPHVFVITGIVASTAFRWLFGFWSHQLKKLCVWNSWQGLIYSSS